MRIHRFHAAPPLPAPLAPLGALVRDCWASWHPEVGEIVARVDPGAWSRAGAVPFRALAGASPEALARAAGDESLLRAVEELAALRDAERARPSGLPPGAEDLLVAYFSCEFGLDQALPIYSGGLGLLAGDHLKAAADLALPLVGVGLLYRNGYFRQEISPDGRQIERYPVNDPATLPVEPALDAAGDPVTIRLRVGPDNVAAAVWVAHVGSVRLYLLDADVPENTGDVRQITDCLYGGDRRHRIRQELLLGVGGVRALRALGLSPTVFHINEGHSAFLALERVRELRAEHGLALDEAIEAVRASAVFTTHTPVPAGNEVFDAGLVAEQVGPILEEAGVSWPDLASLGQRAPGEESIGMTVMALRTSSRANGVSRLHGEVAREMWHDLWPGARPADAPIGHVTNGVHTWSWVGPEVRSLVARVCGPRALEDPGDPFAWEPLLDAEAGDLWAARSAQRARLLAAVAARAPEFDADPSALVIGFSRRFATYKRAGLLLRDPDRLAAILGSRERPVRLVVSGKSHGADEPGKDLIQQIVRASRDPRFHGRIVFLPDYDIAGARLLVQGADVWLNTPRRPLEASGTSGMKAAANGGLNLSILDGWWAEGYDPEVGWAIGDEAVLADLDAQDALDAASLLDILERSVVPTFFDASGDGAPTRWLHMVARAIARLAPAFSTHRMVRDYLAASYLPAHHDGRAAVADGFAVARAAAVWRRTIAAAWPGASVAADPPVDGAVEIRAVLGALTPDDVAAEVLVGRVRLDGSLDVAATVQATPVGADDGGHRFRAALPTDSGDAFSVRLRARREGIPQATGDPIVWEPSV